MDRTKQLLDAAQHHVYKELEDKTELSVYIYAPQDETARLRTAIAFFFSSTWDKGMVTQFGPQALHFLNRGAITMLVDYRVSSRHNSDPIQSMSDARSALRWIRYNAEILRVDTRRVVAVGGGAGAQLALSAAMIPGVADDPSDPNISCVPDALVLFSTIVDTTKKGYGWEKFKNQEDANLASPSRYIGKHHPPMILFHGSEDRFVPEESVSRFAKQVRAKENVCELVVYEGFDNAFYNFNVNPAGFDATLGETDRFLVEQGFLSPRTESDEGFGLGY